MSSRNTKMTFSVLRSLGMAILGIYFSSGGYAFAEPATLAKAPFYHPESVWTGFDGSKFRLCRISSNGAIPATKSHQTTIRFAEDADTLTSAHVRQISRFLENLPQQLIRMSLSAHADQCGDHEYNQDLSRRRGEAVWAEVRSVLPERMKRLPVSGEVNGETRSTGHFNHDRSVKIVVDSLNDRFEFKKVVILDVSGSLHPKNKVTKGLTKSGVSLDELKNIKFEPGTLVYVTRDIRFACQGGNLADYDPVGEDYYHHAMILITSHLNGKVPLETWSDDTDFYKTRGRYSLQLQEKQKQVKWKIK